MIIDNLQATNKYIQNNEPWVIVKRLTKGQNDIDKKRLDTVLYLALESARISALLLQPIMPNSAGKMLDMLGVERDKRGAEFCKFGEGLSGAKLKKGSILFQKVVK